MFIQCQKPDFGFFLAQPSHTKNAWIGPIRPPIEVVMMTSAKIAMKIASGGRFQLCFGAARCLNSSAPPSSTLMISSTPRVIPPEKSFALKRGVMEFAMMYFVTASVSEPSSP